MTRAEKNLQFGIARGLTQVAKAASIDVNESMEKRFDRPTPFTKRATAFLPAKRDTLVARVFVKDTQAGYLRLQETGGVAIPKPGNPLNVPVGQRRNVYGNIPRGAMTRAKARPDTFTVGKGQRLRPGLYQRKRSGRGRARRAVLKLLVAFVPSSRYTPRFRFRETVLKTVMATGTKTVAASIRDAFRTMKPGQ